MTALLTILGLGPGNPAQRTLEAAELLSSTPRILLRTGIHPGLETLTSDPRVSTCDDLYERLGSFDEVYAAVVERVMTMLSDGDLVFAVPGHPLIGERTVTALLARATEGRFQVRIVPGVSALDVVASTLGVDLMASEAQLIDAVELQRFVGGDPFNGFVPEISPVRPVLLSQIYSTAVASAAKLALSRVFPEEHEIIVVQAAGVAGEETVRRCKLFELDRGPLDHLTSAWIPSLDSLEASVWPLTLYRIAGRLRAPDGCPWDRKQTHESLRNAVLEEAYEVVDAIEGDDPDHLAEELGDLQLLVAMHAQIAEENEDFSIADVYDHINRKLVRRHPHVFGDVIATTPDAVVQTWDQVKAGERAATQDSEPSDPYDRLPRSMPVIARVAKLARKRSELPVAELDAGAGDDLLQLVERMAASGLDPERELEQAYRRRSSGLSRQE